ncbi:hypothetical protein GCM10010300_47050 [Streptomyces olivaceoviridis]|uniref:trypsin-like serine peptidase n=1 Tax=Streptomyces olivaceoviridis TaxID=1921 RepID=UPI00167BC7D2|nr:hypothetical protein [Streptomyces olivaceoviridis]GGY97625.1 hypothetical protein GCM10010300_47050 [Streptomyces olivaceoviridis]
MHASLLITAANGDRYLATAWFIGPHTLPTAGHMMFNFRSVRGWTGSGDENYDYGAVLIPTELGSATTWFGFGAWPDADLLKTPGNTSGYPGDKPPGTQWYDARGISSVNPLKVYYDIDTAGGRHRRGCEAFGPE